MPVRTSRSPGARIHSSLTWQAERQDQPAEALSHTLRALELYRAIGHQAMEPTALNDVGYCHGLLGNYQQALTCYERSLDLCRELADHYWCGQRHPEPDVH